MDPNDCSHTDWNAIFTGITSVIAALTASGLTFLKMAPHWRLGRSIHPGPMKQRRWRRPEPIELEGDDDDATKR